MLAVTLIISLCCVILDAKILVVPNANWNQQYGFPGVKLRLTRKGAEHIKDVGVKLLNEQLASLNGFNLRHDFNQPPLQGVIYLNDISTTAYAPPKRAYIQFLAPTYLVLGIEHAAISLYGRFLGQSGVFQVSGLLNGDLSGMSVSIVTSFRALPDGLMSVQVVNCSTVVEQSRFTLHPEGPLGPIIKTFELQINQLIKDRIPSLFCKGLQDIIEKNSPEMFKRLVRAPMSDHFHGFSAGNEVIDRFIRRFTAGLVVDNRNIADPVVTPDFFETQMRGEITYDDSYSETPFYPRVMPIEPDSERMLYFYGSEYTLNSLLYHAYENDKLNMILEEQALPENFKGFIKTTCDSESFASEDNEDLVSGICVGKLIPSLADAYPNTTTKFILLPSVLPEVKFYDHLSTMDVKTRILTYVYDKKTRREKQILVSSADGIADIRLAADDGKFAGDLKLRKLNVRLHRSGIDEIDPDSIAQLAPLAKTFLGPQLSAGLKRGLPYPLQDSITFINPELTIHNGYARLATDFVLGEAKLREKVFEAFQRIKAAGSV